MRDGLGRLRIWEGTSITKVRLLDEEKNNVVLQYGQPKRETARKLHWDWLPEKSGSAFLISTISRLRMENAINNNIANVKSGFGINQSELMESRG